MEPDTGSKSWSQEQGPSHGARNRVQVMEPDTWSKSWSQTEGPIHGARQRVQVMEPEIKFNSSRRAHRLRYEATYTVYVTKLETPSKAST